jgi:outer membrane protein OmpA-like peptidoglycan-associated protein
MKKIVFALVLVILSTPVFAQFGLKEKADREFQKMRYAYAIEHYEQYLKKNSEDDSAKLNLAISYHKVKDTKNAERVFRNISSLEQAEPEVWLEFAEVLSQNGNYEESHTWYSKYAAVRHLDERAQNNLEAHSNVHKFYLDSSQYRIYHLGFNSLQSDFSPAFYQNGIVFSSGRVQEAGVRRVFSWDNSAFLDLYFVDTASIDTTHFMTDRTHTRSTREELHASTKKEPVHHDDTRITSNDTHTLGHHATTFSPDSAWEPGEDANVIPFSKKVNSKYHEGPTVFTSDGNTMYFTRNNFRPGKYKTSEEDINELKIYTATKDSKGEWTNIKEFVHNNNNYSTGHPALSPDNKTMYFVSNMPGGAGGTDIYKSVLENGAWGTPVNLGRPVNTEGNEMFPFVSADNRLFFASTGQGGLGGLDIFEYELSNASAEVLNMGFPVNSMKDDFGLILNASGSTGYFSSNRKRGGTDDDLFMFTSKPVSRKALLNVYVYDAETRDTIYTVVPAVLLTGSEQQVVNLAEQKSGLYTYAVEQGNTYQATAVKGDQTSTKTAEIPKGPAQVIGLPLTQPRDSVAPDEIPADVFTIRNIYFDFDKSNIRPDAVKVLDELVATLNKYPGLKLSAASHTDSRANHDYNVRLSQRRLNSSIAYLVAKGIDPDRIVSREFSGETKLVNACNDANQLKCTAAQHQLNRRTDFAIVK